MGWSLFLLAAWLVLFMVVPLHKWKNSWRMGLAGLIIIIAIESTLIKLGAFKYYHKGLLIYGLPIPYWLSYFPGGMLFDYLRPKSHLWRLLFIPIVSAAYLMLELTMIYFGFFQYINWSIFNSYILNLVGFTVSMWFAEWLEEAKMKEKRRANSPF